MPHTPSGRPEPSEYDEYYERYVSLVPEDDVRSVLAEQCDATVRFLKAIPEATGDYRYAPGKWSVRQILCHLADCELAFAFRITFRAVAAIAPPGPGYTIEWTGMYEYATAARARIAGFKDFWEEDQAIFAPDLPTHLYINKDGIPTVKGYYSHK